MKESQSLADSRLSASPLARPDSGRQQRKGVPEVILTNAKTPEQSLATACAFLERNGRAILVGLPTSVGYGMGGQGQAALLSMLQTCSPVLAVVNTDNGAGAAAMAGLIANRAARARRGEG